MQRVLMMASVVTALTAPAFVRAADDPPIPTEDIIQMLELEAVKRDLKLDAQQRGGLEAIVESMRVVLPDLDTLSPEARQQKIEGLLDKADLSTTSDAALARLFTASQQARFEQIKLHWRGLNALRLDSVAKALAFTEDQRRTIPKLIGISARVPRSGDTMLDIRTRGKLRGAVWEALTDEQQELWEKLAGPAPDFGSGHDWKGRVPLSYAAQRGLLRTPTVLQELRVSEEQRAKLEILVEKIRLSEDIHAGNPDPEIIKRRADDIPRKVRQLEEVAQAGLARILSSEQMARFEELQVQDRGLRRNLLDKRVSDRLGLSAEQQEKIRRLNSSNPRPGDRKTKLSEEELKAWRDRGTKITEEIFDVLTPEQKARLENLQGPKFDFSQGAKPPADQPDSR
jgi:hypothetical protein